MKTSLVDKKVTCEQTTCLIYTILLVIICLLLLAISISCYYINVVITFDKKELNSVKKMLKIVHATFLMIWSI